MDDSLQVPLQPIQALLRLTKRRVEGRAQLTHLRKWKDWVANPVSRISAPTGGPIRPDLRPDLDASWDESTMAAMRTMEKYLVRKARRQGLVLCEVPRVKSLADVDGYLDPTQQHLLVQALCLPRTYQVWSLGIPDSADYLLLSKEALARGWVTLEPYDPIRQERLPHGAVR